MVNVLTSFRGSSRANSVLASPALPIVQVEVLSNAQVVPARSFRGNTSFRLLLSRAPCRVLEPWRLRAWFRWPPRGGDDDTAAAKVVPTARANEVVPRGSCQAELAC